MGAPKGNDYYKLRSKDGRDRIFKTPEELVEACNSYFEWCISNPFYEASVINRTSKASKDEEGTETESLPYTIAEIPKMRPMTLEGLCNYIDIAVNTFREYEKRKDFLHITTRVRQIIENQQFEGAASGFLNANIIARKLGLSDKTESKNENINHNSVELTTEQMNKLIDKL